MTSQESTVDLNLPQVKKQILTVDRSAAAEFEHMRDKRNRPDAVLRVRVVPDSGCGDFRYAMGIEPGPREGDTSINAHGVTVIVDAESELYLQTSRILIHLSPELSFNIDFMSSSLSKDSLVSIIANLSISSFACFA